MSSEMRALTITQPWASAIAYSTKRVENRTWSPPGQLIGQAIAIHAGKRHDWDARTPEGESWALPDKVMVLGAVIAVADLAGCHHSSEASECPGPKCSPWAVLGQYHWQLANVRPLSDPVSCKGALGLWRLPEDVEKAVRAQLGEDGDRDR